MRFGITMVATDRSISITSLARAVEERGFDALWLPDHTHVPVDRRTPYPLGGDLPDRYLRMVDPLVGLAMAAAVTTRLRVGTGVLLVAQRDPIATAKALATIDHESGGRLAVGFGYGWNVEEMADHGVDAATRRSRAHEHLAAMRRLWEDEVAAYSGSHVSLAPSWSWPKPIQRPLPVLVGGAPTAATFGAVAALGNGWIAVGSSAALQGVGPLGAACEGAGRDPSEIDVVCFTTSRVDGAVLDRLAAAGVDEVAFDVPPEGEADVLRVLDDLAGAVTSSR
jgi:probable F420-dependent oxidoreductase